MKKLMIIVIVTIFTCALTSAQENMNKKGTYRKTRFAGYLVDQNCGKKMVMDDIKKSDAKAAKHTKDCSLDEACKAAGYGIVMGGKFYKFDDAGDKKAVDYLNATKKEDNIKVEVTGTMDNDKIKVESIKDFTSKRKKA